MAKLKNEVKNNSNENVMLELKKKMEQQVAEDKFVEAMDTMAEIANNKEMDTDIMYMGAYCYMMTSDNERAAKWVNTILNHEPDNVKARILLGRLCIIEDREEEGLAIYEFILNKLAYKLTDENKADLEELLDYYRYSEAKMIVDNYPCIAKFLKLVDDVPVSNEEVQEVKEEKIDDSAKRAREAVARLRALLQKQKNEEIESSKEIVEEEADSAEETVCDNELTESSINVENITNQIMSQSISLHEKIKMFNAFAAGCYSDGDYQSSFDLLSAALMLDSDDPFVLRNIAYVCIAAGENQQAMEYASKLPMIDFALLHAIKER